MKTIKEVEILLPNVTELEKWAVVSCDQFTSQPKYWEELSEFVGDNASTLNLIFPEVYLEDDDSSQRIETINKTMQEYLDNGVFNSLKDSFILVKRDTESGLSRLGLMVAVDLEEYSFAHPSDASIRSTEGVVLDRIPPRLAIRSDAPIELPHIMLLIDDRQKSVIEPLYEKRASLEKLYDFDLNMNGGHLTGYRVDSKEVMSIFEKYEDSIQNLYGQKTNFIFAVGDGNHSLATAQAHWNNVKASLSEKEKQNHPARFALCEVENLHDDGIVFEPIHRFLFNVDDADFISFASSKLSGDGSVKMFNDKVEYQVSITSNSANAIAQIQEVVDEYLKEHKEATVDYIHGMENLKSIANESKGIAIAMPKIEKTDLFQYVVDNGNLCRKAFSMGEAEEKRYYFEAKKIK